jgi:hypothetical protein
MASLLERPCLHCTEPDKLASREHVVHEAFGGSLVLDEDVCHQCNVGRFSPLDTELVRFVRLFAYANHPAVTTGRSFVNDGLGHYLDAAGVWHTARVARDGTPIVLPQIIFLAPESAGRLRTTIALDASQEGDASGLTRIAQMQRELSHPERLRITTHVVARRSPDLPEVQPALIRSDSHTYAVRAANNHIADDLVRAVRTGKLLEIALLEQPPNQSSFQPHMYKEARYDQAAIARSLVKTALNFVCASIGPDVARRGSFDAARTFARTGEGALFTDFVRPLWGAEVDERTRWIADRVTKPGHHSLLLADVRHMPMVFLTLYERPFAAILLVRAPVAGALPPDSLALGLFDYQKKTHRILRLADEPLAFTEAFAPAVA